jgi:hypothetical protein
MTTDPLKKAKEIADIYDVLGTAERKLMIDKIAKSIKEAYDEGAAAAQETNKTLSDELFKATKMLQEYSGRNNELSALLKEAVEVIRPFADRSDSCTKMMTKHHVKMRKHSLDKKYFKRAKNFLTKAKKVMP